MKNFLHRVRLEVKILGLIIMSFIIGSGTLIFMDLRKETKNMMRQNVEKADLMAETITKSVQNIMDSGYADVVMEWMEDLKKMKGITKLEILKKDGTEAFQDLETVKKVNKILGNDSFNRQEKPPERILEKNDPFLAKVVHTGKKVSFYEKEGNRRFYTQLTPILNKKMCEDCHEYDPSPVRGIIRISSSMEQIEKEIHVHRRDSLLISSLTIILTASLLLGLINVVVVHPLSLLKEGVEKLGRGKLDYRLKVQSKDIIGQLAGSFNEVAESLKKAKEVREKKEFLENILNNVCESIIVFDTKGKILSLSKGAEEIFCFNGKDMLGRICSELEPMAGKLSELLRKEEMFRGEIMLNRANGKIFPAFVTLMPLKDEEDKLLGFIKVTRDLTAEKAKDRLQQQLIHSEKLAATGQLAASVAHELNTPLASINTCIDGIKSRVSKAEGLQDFPRYLDLIKKEIGRCKTITEKLLLLSRKPESCPKPVDVNKSIMETISLVEYEAMKNNITIVKTLQPNIPLIQADETQIRQFILNIIINGIQAIGQDGILEIITSRQNNKVQIIFKDNGCGIKEEDLGKIFEPFFTLKPKGTGLGLSICDKIVKQHKGRISVESKVHEGTQVIITLPLNLALLA